MFAPPLYTVRKLTLKLLTANAFRLNLDSTEEKKYFIKQQDNMLFRQIRLITGEYSTMNRWIIFVDCKNGQSHESELRELSLNGFQFNGHNFVLSESSASMTRTSILSFVDSTIADNLTKRVTLGLTPDKTVLSKWYAYRGLMLSSCHLIENWIPKIIIVPDLFLTIPSQRILHAYDRETTFLDKEGKKRDWIQKDIKEAVTDVRINAFDGCGIHHPLITEEIQKRLHISSRPTSILWRAPFIKGMSHEIDYESFFSERGLTSITDIWGEKHSIHHPMIIMCESMYKGFKYFNRTNTKEDWQNYWNQFHLYNHCVGVAKWNFTSEEEPAYTRANYQILQDLELSYEDFASLAAYSIEWIEKIIAGDPLYTYCFLGLTADTCKNLNQYTRAILKNPQMLQESGVRDYVLSAIKQYKDELKCGKLWLKGCFRFLAPDLILFLEHIGSLPLKGSLEQNEFFSQTAGGPLAGEYLIERNPHISKSEHTILKGHSSDILARYAGHLSNVCMVNCKSITPQRLNGADFDGDLVLVIDNEEMKKGVDRSTPIVMDTEDKITVLEEEDTEENRIKTILRGMNSLIGETSNCATSYHNKMPKTREQKEKYASYISLLSIINGKAIDAAKTGVLYHIPKNIAAYGKTMPYFMKYAGDYYSHLKELSHSKSNMNRLCMELERWEKQFRFKRSYKSFDHTIMMDKNLSVDEGISQNIECIYLEFCEEMKSLAKEQMMLRNYEQYKDLFNGVLTMEEARNTSVNWKYYYDLYRLKCNEVCPDKKMLANIAVTLCYETYPSKNKKFLWQIAGEGVLENLQRTPSQIPVKDADGTEEYLGKKYSFTKWEEL